MRTTSIRLLVALVFAVAAWLSWSESRVAARVADMRQSIATFDYSAGDSSVITAWSDYLPGEERTLSDELRVGFANALYWRGRYDAVGQQPGGNADADILLVAANAAFRQSQHQPLAGPVAVQQLDGVLQAYAAAMKASPRTSDPAYNYEFVSRLRDQVARAQGKPVPLSAAAANGPRMGGDLPLGPTIHGGPGAPPPDAKTEEFQTIMPMEYGDREAQPEATPGAKRERKG